MTSVRRKRPRGRQVAWALPPGAPDLSGERRASGDGVPGEASLRRRERPTGQEEA